MTRWQDDKMTGWQDDTPCSQPPLYWCIFWEMVVRISGDFWGNFNDGDSLRSTFLLSPEHIFSLNKSPDHILRPYFIPEHRDFGKSYWNQALFQNKQSISQHFWVLCIPTAITGTCQKPKIQWFMGSIGSDRTPAFRKAWKPFEFWSFWSHTSKRILSWQCSWKSCKRESPCGEIKSPWTSKGL